MAISVIVTSYESPETLRACLRSLVAQPEASEIVVSDCSQRHPAIAMREEFPGVRFLQFEEVRTVPQLRWAALKLVTGEVVAAVEARCVPSDRWCAELEAAHFAAPASPAVGGPVSIADGASGFDWALYLCEYGAFAPPVPEGPSDSLSGANLSYKRTFLDACSDLTQAGEWETLIHLRWLREGLKLYLCGATVAFENSMPPGTALLQRWHYGRGYAAARVAKKPSLTRVAYALAAFALPLFMTIRLLRSAMSKGLVGKFIRTFGWTLTLNTSWSLGEIVGYLAGKPSAPKIF